MYHRSRKKMRHMIVIAVLLLSYPTYTLHKSITSHQPDAGLDDNIDNTIIDFEEDYAVKFNKKHGSPWNPDDYFNKESYRYTLVNDNYKNIYSKDNNEKKIVDEETTTVDYSVIPLELISTTENVLSVVERTVETNLTVIPLHTEKSQNIDSKQIVELPTMTEGDEPKTEFVTAMIDTTTADIENITKSETTIKNFVTDNIVTKNKTNENVTIVSVTDKYTSTTELELTTSEGTTNGSINDEVQTTFKPLTNSKKGDEVNKTVDAFNVKDKDSNETKIINSHSVQNYKNITVVNARHANKNRTISILNSEEKNTNGTTSTLVDNNNRTIPRHISTRENNRSDSSSIEELDVPIFTELDTKDQPDVPEDYYDSKDVVPTTAPKTVTDKYTSTTELELTTSEGTTNGSINDEVQTTFKPLTNSKKGDEVNKTVDAFNVKDKDSNETKIINSHSVQNYKNITVVNARHANKNRTISILNSEEKNTNGTTSTLVDNNNRTIPRHISTRENNRSDSSSIEELDVPIFTELDTEDQPDVPEDYYDSKDVVPTTAPKTDALSVFFGLAGSVVESVAERVVPKSIFDLFKRMQRQSEALEAERLRSREENGGLGQFGRGILKSISTGITKPFSQLMAGVRDIGSLDSDRGFVTSLASGVTSVANVANSVGDAFKDRVQAIYPGTVWCGDGRSATARSGDLGLFFLTDTCCRQHDACKLYIKSGETKHGLTNTGLFTRSHCSCDAKFRDCLVRTNSLVSAQIGLTYFNVLGPQCFRRAHPIVRCVRKTRITGQKCEEYELDYTKPKMWQWFDNETF